MITTTVKLDSKIFNLSEFRQALSSAVYKSAKVFQSATVDKMVESVPRGRIDKYKGKQSKGFGFSRGFRRSARGQRPAVETGTLIRAVETTRNGEFVATVFIKHSTNPRNRADAQVYAERLQGQMARAIMTREDARIHQIELSYNIDKTVKRFL